MQNKLTADSIIKLWVCKVSDGTKKIEQETEILLSTSEKQRFDATSSINKKREFLLSRALMRHALSQQFQQPATKWTFIDKANSGPIVTNLPEHIYFSLSHSNDLITFVISDFAIGIDIELASKKRNFLALADTFMSDEEINHIKNIDNNKLANAFYQIWCTKEAYYKADPKIQQQFIANEIPTSAFLNKHSEWHLLEGNINSFWCSIVSKSKSPAIITSQFHPNNSGANFEINIK